MCKIAEFVQIEFSGPGKTTSLGEIDMLEDHIYLTYKD